MTIAAIISAAPHEIVTARRDESVAQVVARLAERRIGALPVVEDDKVLGIFSERDLIYGTARYGADMMTRNIGEVMISPAITVTSDTPILSALSLMTQRRIRHLPVVDDGRMTGFVSIGDLVKHRIDKIETEAAAMRDYIQMA